MRNIQLGLFGTIFGLITVYFFDYEVVSERGFFRGYTPLVWASIVVQSGGGLLVACVIKYADNILKGFASSIAIIVSCLASSLLFNTKLTGFLMFGTFLMGVSVFLYSYSSNKSESPESPYLLKNADAQEQIKLNLSSKKNHSESV
jgi:UDP-sugar transporter A1/2/3